MEQDLTVIIPTAARPDYLRKALQTVAEQLAIGRIAEVRVSENLEDRRSEEVCAEFPKLPINYIFRDPPLGHPRHLGRLAKEPNTTYTALLNDDDWWAPGHLLTALRALDASPETSAWYSGTIWANDESLDYVQNHRYVCLEHFSNTKSYLDTWSFSTTSMLALCWMYAPFHWSSMVARTDALVKSVDDLETENAWNADRVMAARLALFGTTLFFPVPQVFVRLHDDNWASNPEKRAQMENADKVWRDKARIIAEEAGVDVLKIWKENIEKFSEKELKLIKHTFQRHYSNEELKKLNLSEFVDSNSERLKKKIKPFAQAWCPPIVLDKLIS
ncbi:MAG: glycosyltransferase family A protein [Flavobacteriaceae bacterium]